MWCWQRCIEVTIASEPGYLDHELVVQQIDGGGGDWVSICADGKTVKLDVRTVGVLVPPISLYFCNIYIYTNAMHENFRTKDGAVCSRDN